MLRLGLLLVVSLGPALAAQERLRVVLRGPVEIPDAVVLLGEVADLHGPPSLVEALAGLELQRLDSLAPVEITPSLVMAAVRDRVGPVRIEGRGSVVRLPVTVTPDEQIAAAKAHLATRLPGADAEIQVVRPPAAFVTGADRAAPLSLVCEPLTNDRIGEVPYRVRILRNGRELGRRLLILRTQTFIRAPVALRDLPRGTVLSLQDVALERVALRRAEDDTTFPDLETLAGRTVVRDIAAGSVLTAALVREPPAVTSGSTVVVRYEGEGFSLSTYGEALATGVSGKRIRVRMPGGTVITAVISGPNEVQADPRD